MSILYSDGFTTLSSTFWTINTPGDWSVVSGKARSINPLTTIITKVAAHAAIADCKVSYKRALTGTSWDTGVLLRTNSTGTTGYFLDPIGTGPASTMDIWRIDGALTSDTQVGSTVTGLTLNDGDIYALKAENVGGNVVLTGYLNGVQVIQVTDSTGLKILGAGQCGIINWNNTNDFDDFLVEDLGGAAATLSAPTPSGTLGTQFTASPGATTDQVSGTFYTVIDSAANLAAVTVAEIKAGQKAGGAAAVGNGNVSVVSTTPSVPCSGLTPGTLYTAKSVQNNTNGDSNVVTTTFTTAAAPPTLLLGRRTQQFVTQEVIQG